MAKVLKYSKKMPEYFDELPQDMQDVAREFLNECSTEVINDEKIEDIECRSRSGFIPYDWNRGGLTLCKYRDLGYFWSGGYSVGIPEAQASIEKWTEQALKDAKEAFIEKYAEELSDLEIKNDDVDYHTLEDKGLSSLANEFSEYEMEHMSGDYSSTQHTIRVLYSGNGEFNVEVFHSISDAPYHRGSDGSKRWTFDAFTAKQLKNELDKIKKEVADSYL